MEETDLNLVKCARNSDPDAFRLLVDRYQRRIFGVCYGMIRHREDALDLTQETFLRIYRNLERFEGGNFFTWAYRIASNVTIDHIRKQRRGRTVEYDDTYQRSDDEVVEEDWLPSRLGMNPGRNLDRKELLARMNAAVLELAEIHREVLVLREVEGMSYQEMADVLDISIGTVMSRLHHARRKMQAQLADYAGPNE